VLADSTRLSVAFFTDLSCQNEIYGLELFGTGTAGWQQATGTMAVPAGTVAMFFTLYGNCTTGGACSVFFDDVDVRARGSVAGARYSLLDRRAPRGKLTYRLQAVGTDGSRTWYGRVTVRGR
jgi:hypothetical protein